MSDETNIYVPPEVSAEQVLNDPNKRGLFGFAKWLGNITAPTRGDVKDMKEAQKNRDRVSSGPQQSG